MCSKMDELTKHLSDIDLNILNLLYDRSEIVKKIDILKMQLGFEPNSSCIRNDNIGKILEYNKNSISRDYVSKVFSAILDYNIVHAEIRQECKLLIGQKNNKFLDLYEIFNLPHKDPIVIAGPCAIENTTYLDIVAKQLKILGIKFLRGGAYKPRTSPYDFQGLKEEGLKILQEVSKKYNLISVTEVLDTRDVKLVREYVDIVQIGARNMQNYELLKEVGQTKCPVILKRGMSASIEEFIYAGEYIALQGNRSIILCERGIRTFETKTRNTLDISSIPIIKNETCLPIIVDLSHSLGRKDIIGPIAKSVLAAGSDGIMVEVHPKPELALSDRRQQLNINEFSRLLDELGIGENR